MRDRQDYTEYLSRKRRHTLWVGASAVVVAGAAIADILALKHTGQTIFHPALSIFTAVSGLSLAAVAAASLRTNGRYMRQAEGRADQQQENPETEPGDTINSHPTRTGGRE